MWYVHEADDFILGLPYVYLFNGYNDRVMKLYCACTVMTGTSDKYLRNFHLPPTIHPPRECGSC
jgi:hypothetical protein